MSFLSATNGTTAVEVTTLLQNVQDLESLTLLLTLGRHVIAQLMIEWSP